MRTSRILPLVGSLLLGSVVAAESAAGESSVPLDAKPAQPPREPIAIGSVRVDAARGSVMFPGRVNQTAGIVELLVCGPGGKTHEAVFVADADPADLQASLLLLGLRPADRAPCGEEPGQSRSTTEIWIEWPGPETTTVVRAESVLFHRGEDRALPPAGWVFTGSETIDGVFMASEEESLIATYCNPWAILNLSHPVSADDTMLAAHGPALPPPGAPVTIRIQPLRPAAPPAPGDIDHSSGGDG